MKRTVAVVGGGVTGLAAARSLARRGADVLLYEQFRIGHDRGSSHGSSRIFRLSYPDARWVRMVLEAVPLWRELETECGETLLSPGGTLDLAPPQANIAALADAGARYELLDAAEIERRWPVRADGEHGLYQPDGAVIHAPRVLAALRAGAEDAGARIVEATRVESPDELDAEVVVVTAGAWARDVVQLEVSVTVETVGYAHFDTPGVPAVLDWAASGDGLPFYGLPAPGVGLKAGLHRSGPAADPDVPASPDPQLLERIGTWLEHRYLGAVGPVASDTCLYTNTPDESFVCERRGKVVVGSACSGHGFKFAPVVGRMVADLADGATPTWRPRPGAVR